MLQPTDTITAPITLRVSASTGDAELAGELRYDPRDPFAVSLAIGVECAEPVVWVFSRDLLGSGVSNPVGEGDITIEPDATSNGRELLVTLATDCLATMTVDRDVVVEFLVETYTVVADGAESDHIDMDAEIAALLG
jgi:hypothetical protein